MNEPLAPGSIPLRERRTLGDEWREFSRVIPAAAGPTQRTEMRRAFYAGALSMFTLITGGLDADGDPTDLDVAYVSSLFAELVAFRRDLDRGRA